MGIVGVLLPDLHESSSRWVKLVCSYLISMSHPRIIGEKTKDPICGEHKTMRGHGREKVESDSN